MSNQPSHYGSTTDGVSIGGTVHGQGPPLVFWHGACGDGELYWQGLSPHLTAGSPTICLAGPWPQRRSPRPQLWSAGRQ
jgi:hypothetical protein